MSENEGKMKNIQDKKKIEKTRKILRAVLQLLFFILMPACFSIGFNGIKYLFQTVGDGNVLAFNSYIRVLLFLVVYTIVFGRFFCGYLCAFGAIGDWIYAFSAWVQKKVLKRKKLLTLPEKAEQVLRFGKYVTLVLIVLLCFTGVYGKLHGVNPWEVFSLLTTGNFKLKGETVAVVLFLLILVGDAVTERFFCRFLCPMGAVFSLLPVLPFSTVKRDEPNCIKGCNACRRKCPVGLKIASDGTGDGECIQCERCLTVCPKGNLTKADVTCIPWSVPRSLIKAGIFFAAGCFLGLCRFL